MFDRGTTVLVPFPFTDLSGSKVRPAVIVSHRLTQDDVIVAFLSAHKQSRADRHDVHVVPSNENGLKLISTVKCAKLATLDKKVILGKLGKLSKPDLAKVTQRLRAVFGL